MPLPQPSQGRVGGPTDDCFCFFSQEAVNSGLTLLTPLTPCWSSGFSDTNTSSSSRFRPSTLRRSRGASLLRGNGGSVCSERLYTFTKLRPFQSVTKKGNQEAAGSRYLCDPCCVARLQRSMGEELTPGRGRSMTGAFLQLVPQFGHLGAERSKK